MAITCLHMYYRKCIHINEIQCNCNNFANISKIKTIRQLYICKNKILFKILSFNIFYLLHIYKHILKSPKSIKCVFLPIDKIINILLNILIYL